MIVKETKRTLPRSVRPTTSGGGQATVSGSEATAGTGRSERSTEREVSSDD